LLTKASCTFLIVGSLLVFSLKGPMGVEGRSNTGVIRDATVINDTASLSFTIKVPDDVSSTIVTKMEQETEDNDDIEGDNEDDEEDETDKAVDRTLRRKKKRQKKEHILQDRAIENTPTLRECIQDVLDEGATGSLPFIDDRAIETQAHENDQLLEIRHLFEEDLYEDDRRMSTCDAEITEEMQEKVRWKQ
jgi:hypothetical protein